MSSTPTGGRGIDRYDGVALLVCGVVFAVFLAIALFLMNHGLHRASDMGLFDQAAWNTSRGLWFESSMKRFNFLGEHAAFGLLLYVPFYWIAEWSGWLLIGQAFSLVLIGGGAYVIGREKGLGPVWSLALLAAVLLMPGLFGVNRSEFHMNATGAAFLMWSLVYYERGRLVASFALFFLMLSCQEDFALTGIGVGLMIALHGALAAGERRRELAVFGGGLAVLSVGWFLLMNEVVIPQYAPDRFYRPNFLRERYGFESLSMSGKLWEVATDPLRFFGRLGEPQVLTYAAQVLLGTTGLALLAPTAWVALGFSLGPHLLSLHGPQTSIEFYYQALPCALVAYGSVHGLRRLQGWLRGSPWQKAGAVAVPAILVVSGIVQTLVISVPQITATFPEARRRNLPEKLATVQALIPPDASVKSTVNLAVHFCHRDEFLVYPRENPTAWAVFDVEWVLDREDYRRNYAENPMLELYHADPPLFVYRTRDFLRTP